MGRLITLEELEAYRQEVYHAQREDRVPRYRNPREVFNEDPNREDGFLVELTADELEELEAERQRKLTEEADIKEQVIQEIMDNGNVAVPQTQLPDDAAPEDVPTVESTLTREQAESLYDAATVAQTPSIGALEDTSHAPSIAPEDSPVNAPGSITGAPQPNQTIVEQLALNQNATDSQHQNVISTPNPPLNTTGAGTNSVVDNPNDTPHLDGPDAGQPVQQDENGNPITPENPPAPLSPDITEAELPHPDTVLNPETPTEDTNVPDGSGVGTVNPTDSGNSDPGSSVQPEGAVTDNTAENNTADAAPNNTATADNTEQVSSQVETTAGTSGADTQQFQPVPGENAGPTVPGAETIQTPTLNDEASVPSLPATEIGTQEPTNNSPE